MRSYCQHHLLLAAYTWLLTATTCVSAQQVVHPSPVASRTVIYAPKKISTRFTERRLQQEQARANADPFGQQRRLQESCGAIECCVDCVCCGPGTVWTGELCVPNLDQNGDSGASLFCDAIDFALEGGCVDNPTCAGGICCGEGTKSVVDPTRDAEACYCVPDGTGEAEPPRSPRPTFSPTPGPRTPSPAGAQTPDPTTSPTLVGTNTDPTFDPTLDQTTDPTFDPATSSPTIRTRSRPPADGDIDDVGMVDPPITPRPTRTPPTPAPRTRPPSELPTSSPTAGATEAAPFRTRVPMP